MRAGSLPDDSARYDRFVLRLDRIEGEDVYTVVDCGGHEIIGEWERAAGPGST